MKMFGHVRIDNLWSILTHSYIVIIIYPSIPHTNTYTHLQKETGEHRKKCENEYKYTMLHLV